MNTLPLKTNLSPSRVHGRSAVTSLNSTLDSTVDSTITLHRSQHGAAGWMTEQHELYQPQDGAAIPTRIAEITNRLTRSLREPEDARLTGGTRSLMRRLLALNLISGDGYRRNGSGMARVA